MTRLRLYASTCKLISVETFTSLRIWKWVEPIQCFSVPNTCSTVRRRIVMHVKLTIQSALHSVEYGQARARCCREGSQGES